MLSVTVIKSQTKCRSCAETVEIVTEVVKNFEDKVKLSVLTCGTPEAAEFGLVSTPMLVIGKKIYAMGKPVIRQKVEGWIKKELGL